MDLEKLSKISTALMFVMSLFELLKSLLWD